MLIRKLLPSDRDAFIELCAQFYDTDAVTKPIPREFMRRSFDEIMRSDVYLDCYMFMDGDIAAGYALCAKTYSQEAGGIVVWIDELYIMPQFQGKGIGKEFFAFILRETNGVARLRLEVEKDNTRAISLYEKMGFTPLEYSQMVIDYNI